MFPPVRPETKTVGQNLAADGEESVPVRHLVVSEGGAQLLVFLLQLRPPLNPQLGGVRQELPPVSRLAAVLLRQVLLLLTNLTF